MNLKSLQPGCVIALGQENSPKMIMTSASGSIAEIYMHGAHVTSWIPSGSTEKLYLSSKSAFGSNTSIRGGIPVIFPQFSDHGPLPKHGFARRMDWQSVITQVSGEDVIAGFNLLENAESLVIWPHPFSASLLVTLSQKSITVKLRIKNTGDSAFSFTSGLHTYLSIENIQKVKINGLGQCSYIDTTMNDRPVFIQADKSLQFGGEVDRIYTDAPSDLIMVDGKNKLKITSEGFTDAVTWNPWAEKSAKLADMLPSDYQKMVCIEAAVIQKPITLDPQKSWTGSQTLSL